MQQSLAHRGPDGYGIWSDKEGLAVGDCATIIHRRLKIIDLSESGHQPMVSPSGRWIISFNGEIYNYKSLREDLLAAGLTFRGSSDTEVLLNAIEKYGVQSAIERCRGMFAIILYDKQCKDVYLIRDRLGEKPLYYGFINGDLVAASELKAFYQHPDFEPDIDHSSIGLFLKYNYVPTPHSIFKNIKKAEQSTIIKISLKNMIVQSTPYWQTRQTDYKRQMINSLDKNIEHATDTIHKKLKEVVGLEMNSDVPLGCFLSGGIDSSLITALMQEQSSQKINTFSIGFEDILYDETPYSRQIAKHLNTNHTEWIVQPREALATIEKMPVIYDEPFSDSSQIVTFILSQLTKAKATVCLSGDGADELFAGYTRHKYANKLWTLIQLIPAGARPFFTAMLKIAPLQVWRGLGAIGNLLLPNANKLHQLDKRIEKTIPYFAAQNENEFYDRILSQWFDTDKILLNSETDFSQKRTIVSTKKMTSTSLNEYMLWHDQKYYLSDDIMVKVDRASMAASLETRAPYLDHELFELVESYPVSIVQNANHQKIILRNILKKYVPETLFVRPKQGFEIPLASWLRHELKELMLDLLSETRIKKQGLFNSSVIQKYISDHLKNKRNVHHHLWSLIMFQLWHDRWVNVQKDINFTSDTYRRMNEYNLRLQRN